MNMEKLKQWANAYPLEVFPEPDFKRVNEILVANGMTLDAVSASVIRHTLARVLDILNNQLRGE
jgi:hypothetical protein